MDFSPSGSSVHGIFQAGVLETLTFRNFRERKIGNGSEGRKKKERKKKNLKIRKAVDLEGHL